MLGLLFSYESMRAPTRWLIFYSIMHPQTREETVQLAKLNTTFWLVGNDRELLGGLSCCCRCTKVPHEI
jgi:hypothetical protein